jgi:CHAT domain-containing protein
VSEPAARDWSIFREAYRRGLPNADLWGRLEQVDAWTALPAPQAIETLRNAHEHSNRDWFSAINIVYFKWYRKTGYSSDQAGNQQVQALWQKIAAGGGSAEEREAGTRLWVAFSLLSDLVTRDPTARSPGSAEEQAKAKIKAATQHASTQIFAKLLDHPAPLAGMVTPESIAKLEGIRSEFAELRSKTAGDDGGLPDVCYGAGQTDLALAKSYVIAGRIDDARKAFAESASFFEQGGLAEKATEVRATAPALDRQLQGRFDAAAAEKLSELNEVEAKQSDQDTLKRIDALLELSRIETNAFDIYAALQNAEAASAELIKLGFVDPSATEAAKAVDQWLEVAIKRFDKTGNPLLGLVTRVSIWYRTLFSARYAHWVAQDGPKAEALLAAQAQMDADLKSLNAEAAEIEFAREARTREFFPTPSPAVQTAPSARKENDRRADELATRSQKIDTALNSIQEKCNERLSAKAPMDDLLTGLAELTTEADALNMPIYSAKVRLMAAYVLRGLARGPEMAAAAREARERLLAGRPASLASFSEGFERRTFLDTYRREMEAAALSQNLEEIAAICRTVINDFEKIRYNVRDPYRSASLLVYLADFYQFGVVTAFRRQRWDDLLETMELIKARSAIRPRGEAMSAPRTETTEIARLEAEFERLSREEATDPTAAPKRRQIWDLLSVLRSQDSAKTIPEFSLGALREALRTDEALVGYFWLNESVFLTICIDRERCEVDRIILSDEQLGMWQELFGFIQALKSTAGRNFERAVQSVGNFLLSPKVREFIRTKERLIFSPHRGLHLFPFHAVRWSDAEFIGAHFAVRYVPNFSSVMLPWIQRHEPRFFGVAIEQFADPVIPNLPGVEADLSEIRDEYLAANATVTTLFGRESTRAEFNAWRERPEFTRARCVHFGTHGISVLNLPDEPLDARILLQDEWLDCMDIAQLSLAADVVVLSACESGQQSVEFRKMATGGGVPGDEIFGLQSAFFQAGTRCVLGALWLVETESSSKLIRLFHEGYAKGSDAEIALRDAVRVYLADSGSKPGIFYWAPYFLSCLGTMKS